jgi:hypothetical protein
MFQPKPMRSGTSSIASSMSRTHGTFHTASPGTHPALLPGFHSQDKRVQIREPLENHGQVRPFYLDFFIYSVSRLNLNHRIRPRSNQKCD